MATTLYRALLVVLLAMTISAAGQTPTSQAGTSQGPQEPVKHKAPNPKKPSHPMLSDIVCFGYYPNWSVQFQNGEARYVGMNQPDKYFPGTFRWVPEDKVWEWHRRNGTTPRNGQYALSANISESACTDQVKRTKYPYSGQVYLPRGDMVTGCCRKLPPGEAAIGPHGVPASQPTPPMRPARPPRPAGPQPGIPQNVPPPQ